MRATVCSFCRPESINSTQFCHACDFSSVRFAKVCTMDSHCKWDVQIGYAPCKSCDKRLYYDGVGDALFPDTKNTCVTAVFSWKSKQALFRLREVFRAPTKKNNCFDVTVSFTFERNWRITGCQHCYMYQTVFPFR